MEYNIIKSYRKTLSLQVKNGEIIVRVPYFTLKKTISEFIEKNESWIEEKLENSKQKKSIIDPRKINLYKLQAKSYIPKRVQEIAKKNNIKYNSVKITNASSRWGSCTSKKNLNFSYRLILTPEKIIDYVIIHELCHLKHMNHSKRFWSEVERLMPDYKKHRKWLKDNSHKF